MSLAITALFQKMHPSFLSGHSPINEETDDNDSPPKHAQHTEHQDEPLDFEPAEVRIATDNDGNLYCSNQADDYFYRDPDLATITFYDFVRCFQKEKQGGHFKEQGRYLRFKLIPPHTDSSTHMLLRVFDPDISRPGTEVVPRVIGTSIPRRTTDQNKFFLFMLAHFSPFSSIHLPLILNRDLMHTFTSFPFSSLSQVVMLNWDAIHECEDEHDAERMKKKESNVKKTKSMYHYAKENIPKEFLDDASVFQVADINATRSKLDTSTLLMRAALLESGWMDPPISVPLDITPSGDRTLNCSSKCPGNQYKTCITGSHTPNRDQSFSI
ncbi:hypothetical protein BS47DRAFT_1365290 [Hydnum rufescens UP504]|uniref:Uncharacterized protein n=1 Tax=Hydnum rufescens UP504 TaxID=1448309 RepID=A0A9P6APT8_9AGAM|nr:hypothetical protein BS47DRAFT_1365290 [Hydnum rufescens UP504]